MDDLLLTVPPPLPSQVATVVVAKIDMVDVKVTARVTYLQLNIKTTEQFNTIAVWTLLGIIMALLNLIMSIPAAYQVSLWHISFAIGGK